MARKARECPAVFSAVADGRIHLSGAVLLAPHLTPENADELLAAAARKTKSEIELLLAHRFPKGDVPTQVAPVPASASASPLLESAPGCGVQHAPGHVEAPHPRVTPLAPERYSVRFTLGQEAYENLRYAQALMGHQISPTDLAAVFDRALGALVDKLEKTKFAATSRPRATRGKNSTDPRNIPAHVKRAVWERDGGQCGFVSEGGARCPERSRLEFDHVLEVARGGEATVVGMRLRCRAHNQHEAECTFGAGFMERKREESRRAAAERKSTAAQERVESETESGRIVQVEQARAWTHSTLQPLRPSAPQACRVTSPPTECTHQDVDQDLLHCLEGLRVRPDLARWAVDHSRAIPESLIEQRLHAALKFIGQRGHAPSLQRAAIGHAG